MSPLLRDPRRSLRVKIIAWSFVPTTIILLAVALVTFYAYQEVTEDLVVGRNRELTRLSAGRLAVDLSEYRGFSPRWRAMRTSTRGTRSSSSLLSAGHETA